MKTLRFIGMAIVAIIMSVNFVACSDDDEEDNRPLAEKKIPIYYRLLIPPHWNLWNGKSYHLL